MFGATIMTRGNSHQYEEIVGDTSNGTNNNHHKFWDVRSFFRSWSLMKVLMLGMTILLIGIIVVQGAQERSIEANTIEHEQQVEANMNSNSPFILPSQTITSTNSNSNSNINVNIRSSNTNAADPNNSNSNRNNNILRNNIPMPSGVNLGSWLSLEDYFFAGTHNSVEVATPGIGNKASMVASCLPPLHVGSTTGPKWQSETDLFANLMDPLVTEGGSVKHAVSVIAAHRASFVDLDTDLETLAALGITTVRVPMGWCWTDVDPRKVDLSLYESDAELLRDFACEDPFFTSGEDEEERQILWPAIPKPLVEDLLRACARAGLKASLDVHTYPGGTSIGTFSGVWPHWPRFWTHGGDGVGIGNIDNVDTTAKGFGIGHGLFRNLVEWMEDLSDRDLEAFEGLRGLSPMNEPAHLAGSFGDFGIYGSDQFLPPLPVELENEYLEFLNANDNSNSNLNDNSNFEFPRGNHLRVFYWFQGAIEIFRSSKLPSLGKELQANIIESIFRPSDNGNDQSDDNEIKLEKQKDEALRVSMAIATWWCSNSEQRDSSATTTTSARERSEWAVLDVHHYHAWSDTCSGTIDGQNSAYACGDAPQRSAVLKECSTFVQDFRNIIDGVCGFEDIGLLPSKLMSAEFSAASHHSVRESCSDIGGLRESYIRQVEAAVDANVELFYWSYQMPYGGAFKQSGWSFRELMYRLGVLGRPDTPQFDCDAHLYDDPDVPP